MTAARRDSRPEWGARGGGRVAVAGPRDGRAGDMAAAAGGGRTGTRRHVCAAPARRAVPRCGPRPANVAASRGGDAGAGGGGRASPALTAEWEVPTAAPLSSSALPVTRASRERQRGLGVLGAPEWQGSRPQPAAYGGLRHDRAGLAAVSHAVDCPLGTTTAAAPSCALRVHGHGAIDLLLPARPSAQSPGRCPSPRRR